MQIIPVIDLLDGQVVHARRGEREHYRPIVSSLCASSEPLAVVQALLQLYPFRRIYIADLDAIQRRGNHRDIVASIVQNHPGLECWLDIGADNAAALTAWQGLPVEFVIGSESVRDMDAYNGLLEAGSRVLSLDFNLQRYLGPMQLLQQPGLWPQHLIVMSLGQVGSAGGPDVARLREIRDNSGQRSIYAAGGVRNIADLLALESLGMSGALIATALHDGTIASADIMRMVAASGDKKPHP